MPTTFDNLTICSVEDFYEVIDRSAAQYMLGATSQEDCDAKVQAIITRAQKNFIKPLLQDRFADDYPNTADGLIVFHDALIDSVKARMRKQLSETGTNAITPPVGQITTADPLFEQTYPSAIFPSLWYTDGAPVNGTSGSHAGLAENGAYLIDTTNWISYINRGTKDSPTWEAWDATALVDYILNPTLPPLLEAVRYQSVLLALEKATFNDNGDFDGSLKKYTDKEEIYATKLKEAMTLCLKLLRIDASGDGAIQDFEATRSGEELPFA